jgi:iron complex outermembrane receptor protein
MSTIRRKALPGALILAATAMAIAPAALQAAAADAAAAADNADTTSALDEVIVTGTRAEGITAAESAAPIQILSAQALQTAASSPSLMAALAQLVPSLQMQAFGADMAGQTLQYRLYGLSPNDVLVLVDGKRRHTTSNLAVDVGSPYQGAANVDVNMIPIDAIDHIEVYTEGAAAQYGTDAITGVINIILKKNSSGGIVNATRGGYFNGGGVTDDVSGSAGFEPVDGGYFTISGDWYGHGHSQQGAIDERVINPANLTTPPFSNVVNVNGYPYVNMIMGDGEQHWKTTFLNSGAPVGDSANAYFFASYGEKTANSYENYRTPTKVSFTDPTTMVTTYPFPFGFDPQEGDRETDYQFNGGVKGILAGWNWDLSSGLGGDKHLISTLDTANAGIYAGGVLNLQNIYDGYLKSSQWATTLDVNHDFAVGLAAPLNVAFGVEYRRETYKIGAGTPASYLAGGAQSYPGFTPSDQVDAQRKNYAAYVDFTTRPIDQLRVDVAGRYEHYSDFGNATVGKINVRYDLNPQFAIRGTVSNGFRAPTLAEEFYASTNVAPQFAFVQLPPNSVGGKLLGLGNGLEPEKSTNYGIGFVFRPLEHLTSTLDFFYIRLNNRIVGSEDLVGESGGTVLSPAILNAIAVNGNQLDPGVTLIGANIFANGIDTRTEGFDFTLNFPFDYAEFGHVTYGVGIDYNDTAVTKLPPNPPQLTGQLVYGPEAISDVTTATPRYTIDLNAAWNKGPLSITLDEKIYGPASEYENDDADNGGGGPFPASSLPSGFDYFRSSIGVTPITNMLVSYQLTKWLRISGGANNLFNRFPPKLNSALLAHEDNFFYGDNQGVQQYPSWSPFGINGGFYFARATVTW